MTDTNREAQVTETCSTPVPTQAAIDLCIALGIPDHHAPTIQAAFAEREARLVRALKHIKHEARKNKPDPDRIYGFALAALKDRTHG